MAVLFDRKCVSHIADPLVVIKEFVVGGGMIDALAVVMKRKHTHTTLPPFLFVIGIVNMI